MGKKRSRNRARGSQTARAKPTPALAPVPVPAQAPPLPAPRSVVTLWYLAAAITVWAFGFTIMRGSDLYWHLAAGDRMATYGGFLHQDPWSFTFLGKPWLDDEWLSERIYHWWVALFGLQALAWWKWSVLAATYLVLMRALHRVTGDLLSAYLGAVLAIWVGEAFLDVRPQLYSLLGFTLLLQLTLGRPRPSWWVPVLFLIWVQLHAVFVFGLMALSLLLAPALVRGPAEERRRALLIGLASGAVCLLNPNTVTVFTRPIRYALTSSPYRSLGEWLPPFQPGGIYSPPYPYMIGAFLACTVILLIRHASGRRQPVGLMGIALGGLTLAMSLKSRRFVSLFGIAESIALASTLAPWVQWALRRLEGLGAARLWLPPLAALTVGSILLWPYPLHSWAFHYLVAEDTFPVETLNFVQANHIEGKVYAYYNWGGYLDWRTQGALKEYIDGRADMVFDDATYSSYVAVLNLQPGWLRAIEDSGADYALWPTHSRSGALILKGLLATGRWRLLYEDGVSQLLERADRPQRTHLAATPESPWRELAAGSADAELLRLSQAEMHYKRALEMMPYFGAACVQLMKVQALQGRIDDARATAARCEGIYPDRPKYEAVSRWLDSLAESRR
jgi:tetratricopeptide (TPR) repeat protein